MTIGHACIAAKRAGIAVDTSAKSRSLNTASAKGPADYQHKAALDADDAPKPPAKVDVSVGQAIAKARQEKKDSNGKAMSQKDLATAVNEKPTVVSGSSCAGGLNLWSVFRTSLASWASSGNNWGHHPLTNPETLRTHRSILPDVPNVTIWPLDHRNTSPPSPPVLARVSFAFP